MVNQNGRCFVFDSRGSGYARGEGVGTVILKRLDDALIAGDPIHAVIRNSALNQDGKTAGISLPSSEAQAALMKLVYSSAGLDPKDTPYVECHGTVSASSLLILFFLSLIHHAGNSSRRQCRDIIDISSILRPGQRQRHLCRLDQVEYRSSGGVQWSCWTNQVDHDSQEGSHSSKC